jgi:uncharacterized Fe-S center protein
MRRLFVKNTVLKASSFCIASFALTDRALASCFAYRCSTAVETRDDPCYEIICEKCTKCGECLKVCPVEAIYYAGGDCYVIDHLECICCGQCVYECPNNAIKEN